uniref:helix-turn-helix-type transcriptional regulator n=1 Tax=Amycolatopsis solani TaxID=3028615 RepID=UPI0025B0078F
GEGADTVPDRIAGPDREPAPGARDAAAAAFADSDAPAAEVPVARRAVEIERAAESLGFATMAALLNETLDAIGPAATWNDVLVPVLHKLGGRWLRGEACFEAEWALTTEISRSLERYCARFADPAPGRVVLLSCCPHERHTLPMEVLRAALAEIGVLARFLGQMVPAETTVGMAAKLDPALVVLWSMAPSTVDDLLRQRIERLGFAVVVAGAGWEYLSGQDVRWANDLDRAVDLVTEHLKG